MDVEKQISKISSLVCLWVAVFECPHTFGLVVMTTQNGVGLYRSGLNIADTGGIGKWRLMNSAGSSGAEAFILRGFMSEVFCNVLLVIQNKAGILLGDVSFRLMFFLHALREY